VSGAAASTRACALAELAVDRPHRVVLDGRAVCLVRTGDGAVHAIDDTCTHADVSLSEGEVEGRTIECWLHGSRFDLVTGEPTGLPATRPVAVHDVTIDDSGDVLVAVKEQ
jgi:3-phenylpropionate/trans-cinnamate dioxygenase ferredoxin subunit